MENQKIILLCEKFVYKIHYMLFKSKSSSAIHIRAYKYNKKQFLFDKNTPCLHTETNFTALPLTTTYSEAENLFKKIVENNVLPIELDYIPEIDKQHFAKGANYKIRTGYKKETLAFH